MTASYAQRYLKTKFSFIAKFRDSLRQVQQVKLVNKKVEDRKRVFIDTHTKLQQL